MGTLKTSWEKFIYNTKGYCNKNITKELICREAHLIKEGAERQN